MLMDRLILTVHLLGVMIWVGAFSTVGALGRQALGEAEAPARRALWRAAKRTNAFALVGLALGVAGGLTTFLRFLGAAHYLQQPWMHAKLTAVVVFLALHVAVTLRMRRDAAAAEGAAGGSKGLYVLANALGGPLAFAIVFFVLVKPWERLF